MDTDRLLFPKSTWLGPRTGWAISRALLVWLVVAAFGLFLAQSQLPQALRTFGLGLVFPGAGYLFGFHEAFWHGLMVAAALGAFAIAAMLWFATGNVILPFAVWLLCAVAAASMQHDMAWQEAPRTAFLLVSGLAGIAVVARLGLILFGALSRKRKNLLVESYAAPKETPAGELSLDDLKLIRVLLDRALQPVEKFDGFEMLDQFQTAALRYQLNFAGYGLALYQANHAPAFQSYLTQAQRNLILKQQNRKNWAYWELENLWGNLRRGADPMARDNIMLTGFVAAQMAMFEAASGQNSGALIFKAPDGAIYRHDLQGMVETLGKNFRASSLGLVACEPNWVYPLCNGIGSSAMRFKNPALWQELREDVLANIDAEFLSASGNLVPCRSSYFGFGFPSAGGAVVQSLPCFFYNASLPELAQRHWAVERAALCKNGRLNPWRIWPFDTGNYRISPASSLSATAAAAMEMGDTEIAKLLLHNLDERCPTVERDGVQHRPRASVWAHGAEVMARAGKMNSFKGLMQARPGVHRPFVESAAYPDVLVAAARADQGALRLVLYPGRNAGPVALKLAGLKPLGAYSTPSGVIKADPKGNASFSPVLAGRIAIDVLPME